MHYIIKPRNFRIRSRIYPRNYGYSIYASNISSVDQNITNFGEQTDVSQNVIVNQAVDIDKKKK